MKKWTAARTIMLLFGLSIARLGYTQTADATQVSRPMATVAQIERLTANQRAPSFNPSRTSPAGGMNVCVEHYLREIDRNKRGWNSNDPRWGTLATRISESCAALADSYKKLAPAFLNTYAEALRKGYEKHLSSPDADTLIRFYESDVGRRYLSFQDQLAAADARGMGTLLGGKGGTGARGTTPEVLSARMDLLRLSKTFALFLVPNDGKGGTAGDGSGVAAIAIAMQVAAVTQGELLDRIRTEYSADLSSFATFVQSPAEASELRALYEATSAASESMGKTIMEVSPELNGDLNKWQELYRSLPAEPS